MLGDVAVRPEHLSNASPPSPVQPVATGQQAKTETAAGTSSTAPADKVDPLENKEMSKTTKKILANSPPKVTVQPNGKPIKMSVEHCRIPQRQQIGIEVSIHCL